MQIYSYGEDAYTLWVMQNELKTVLKNLGILQTQKTV